MKTNRIGSAIPDHYGQIALQALIGGRGARGIKVISIDPQFTNTAEMVNARWIAPRPGSDVALMLGIAHTLYVQGRYDRAFLDKYTVGFDKFVPYLLGKTDGTPKDAAWAASVSGIDAGTIRQLAQQFASGRTMLMSGWAIRSEPTTASKRIGCSRRWRRCWVKSACPAADSA